MNTTETEHTLVLNTEEARALWELVKSKCQDARVDVEDAMDDGDHLWVEQARDADYLWSTMVDKFLSQYVHLFE